MIRHDAERHRFQSQTCVEWVSTGDSVDVAKESAFWGAKNGTHKNSKSCNPSLLFVIGTSSGKVTPRRASSRAYGRTPQRRPFPPRPSCSRASLESWPRCRFVPAVPVVQNDRSCDHSRNTSSRGPCFSCWQGRPCTCGCIPRLEVWRISSVFPLKLEGGVTLFQETSLRFGIDN